MSVTVTIHYPVGTANDPAYIPGVLDGSKAWAGYLHGAGQGATAANMTYRITEINEVTQNGGFVADRSSEFTQPQGELSTGLPDWPKRWLVRLHRAAGPLNLPPGNSLEVKVRAFDSANVALSGEVATYLTPVQTLRTKEKDK